jgi:hypothetical protein
MDFLIAVSILGVTIFFSIWLSIASRTKHTQRDSKGKEELSKGHISLAMKNYAEAIKWFSISAKKGNSQAQYQLSLLYMQEKVAREGVGALKDWDSVVGQREKMTDPLTKQAEMLVPAVKVLAISSFVPMSDKFRFLCNIRPNDWDFFITVATVFVATTRLKGMRIGEKREEALMNIVFSHFNKFDRQAFTAFEDCNSFFADQFDRFIAAGHSPQYSISDSVGKWIAWNLLQRVPSSEQEISFVRAIGVYITNSMFGWWGDK